MTRRKRWSFFSPPLENGLVRWLDDFYRGEFTPAGRAVLWGLSLSGTMLVGSVTESLNLCFGFCMSSLILAGIVGHFFRPRLKVMRHIHAYPTAGETYQYRVDATNVGRRTIRNLLIEERRLPPDLRPLGEAPRIELLDPGETKSVTLSLRCLSRDHFILDRLQGATTFPSGLIKAGSKSRRTDRLIVYPKVTEVRELDVPHSQNHQPGGIAVASRVGESTEFLGTREWRQGDRIRDIHWPSSARVGRLIAREYQEEYFVRLAVVLDVEAPRARDEVRLERAVSLTAGIADALARKDYIVDIFAAGDEVHHFRAGRAIARLDNILEVLAGIEAGRELDLSALETALIPESQQLSAVILVMMDWDARRRELVERLRAHGIAIRVLCVKPNTRGDGLAPSEWVEVVSES
ncbi:MAG: DUF58 domain-containing protein [Planctomycetota bacterium]